jgi:hypothetical protein
MLNAVLSENPRRLLAPNDRRNSNRMPIEQDVRYRVLGSKKSVSQAGSGRTRNMSSRGVLFTTESPLAIGQRIELSVSWPAQLDNTIPLKLIASGILVRATPAEAVMSIEKHEFRTRGSGL